MKRVVAACLVSLLVTVSASRATWSADEPCAMFDTSSIGRALGSPASGPKSGGMPNGFTSCAYTFGRFNRVSITVQKFASDSTASAQMKDQSAKAASFMGAKTAPVPNVGDEALHLGNMVYVRRGVRVATVTVLEAPAKALADAEKIARTARR